MKLLNAKSTCFFSSFSSFWLKKIPVLLVPATLSCSYASLQVLQKVSGRRGGAAEELSQEEVQDMVWKTSDSTMEVEVGEEGSHWREGGGATEGQVCTQVLWLGDKLLKSFNGTLLVFSLLLSGSLAACS